MRQISLNLPLDDRQISDLAMGDKILLSGEIYSARDQAHKRLIQILNNHQPMPIDLAKT
ncbi:MAG TPA: fumarate hydratase C-terminal domain-containing protein, partial [Candidatus Cloacimonadota bacterium]|nr:fumarate hydratase C-terminal domain-containing protein [Candidatus Cloacimonadota bacterium]